MLCDAADAAPILRLLLIMTVPMAVISWTSFFWLPGLFTTIGGVACLLASRSPGAAKSAP